MPAPSPFQSTSTCVNTIQILVPIQVLTGPFFTVVVQPLIIVVNLHDSPPPCPPALATTVLDSLPLLQLQRRKEQRWQSTLAFTDHKHRSTL